MFNENTLLQSPKELFDVRLKIVRHTNPLRAKILIFSILYHPFKFSTRDWLTIKMQDLDNLIRHLYSLCPTPTVLEQRLYETARNLNQQEEEFTTARVIFKAMNSLYRTSETESVNEVPFLDENHKPSQSDSAEKVRSPDELAQIQPEEPEPDFDDDEETQLLDLEGGNPGFAGKPLELFLPSHPNPASDLAVEVDDDLTQPLFVYDLNEVSESISYESGAADYITSPEPRGNDLDLEEATAVEPLNLSQPSSFANSRVTLEADNTRSNITSSLLRKMALDRDVQRLIDEQRHKVRESLVESIRYLEQEFERMSLDLTPSEQISLKYPALQQLTDTLAADLTGLQNILIQEAKSAIAPPPQASGVPPNAPSHTGPAIPQAIISLLNPLLKPQGIKTSAKFKENGLYIILESAQTLNPQQLLPFVRAALMDAHLTEIDRIKVYSRKPGHSSPEWIQTLLF